MKPTAFKIAKYFVAFAFALAISCDKDEDPCFETVCYGPDGTDCVEEPKTESAGCFAPSPGS